MPKTKTQFVCQECGYESSQWMGKCPECGNWNTLKEFKTQTGTTKSKKAIGIGGDVASLTPKKLQEITSTEKSRIKTEFS
jgi:DNA repair protein RadA/Sms